MTAKHRALRAPDLGRSRRRDAYTRAMPTPPRHRLHVELRSMPMPMVERRLRVEHWPSWEEGAPHVWRVSGTALVGLSQHFLTWASAMRFADRLTRPAGSGTTTQRGTLAGGRDATALIGMGVAAPAGWVRRIDADLADDADDVPAPLYSPKRVR